MDTAQNGPDIYTKAVSAPTMNRLGPLETGYLDRPRPLADAAMTPTKFEELGRPARL